MIMKSVWDYDLLNDQYHPYSHEQSYIEGWLQSCHVIIPTTDYEH